MKLKIVTILCVLLMVSTVIPVQAQREDAIVSEQEPDYELSIKTRKILKTAIFIVKVDEDYNGTTNIGISRGLGIIEKTFTIDKIPAIKVKFFLIKASRVHLRASLINGTESETASITRGFTSRALIIVRRG